MLPNYNNELNKILFKTNRIISVPAGNEDNIALAGTAVKNLTDYGFVVDERGLNLLATSSKEEIEKWYFDTLSILKDEMDITSVKPTYPNFPNEIMSRTDWQLMINDFKELWETNPLQESDETNQNIMNITNGDNKSNSNTSDGSGDNNDGNTNSGRDTINLGYEAESRVVVNNNQQQTLGVKEIKKPKIITTIDGRDKRLVVDTTAQIFNHALRRKKPTKTQIKEVINPFIENVQNWNTYVTQCTNRDMLTYLYARALIDAKKIENMPDLKAKEYLKVAQQVSKMKEHPIYEVRQLNDRENEKVAEYCKKNNTTPEVARKQLFIDYAINKKDFSENMQIKAGPKYEVDDVRVPNDTFVKITSCGDKLSSHKLRQFIATGLEKIPDLETEISGNKSEKMWKSIFDKQLHIKSDFPQLEKVSMVNNKLQNNIPLVNIDREIEKAKREERYEDILKLLANRPNMFVKRVNEMLNLPIKNPEQRMSFAVALLQTARETLPKANSEDLVTFISYLKSRTRDDRLKVHNVMGKIYVDQEKTYTPLPPKTAELFTQIARDALGTKLISDKAIGTVYIEPNMEKIALPKSKDVDTQRKNTYPKGSRISLIDGKQQLGKVRFMIWTDEKVADKSRDIKVEDTTHKNSIIDISASFFKEENGNLQHQASEDLAWYADKENSYEGCSFSGNAIIDDSHKSMEFIDLDLKSLQDADIAYVMLYVNVWSNNTMLSEENINFGWRNQEEEEEITLTDTTQTNGELDVKSYDNNSQNIPKGETQDSTVVFNDIEIDATTDSEIGLRMEQTPKDIDMEQVKPSMKELQGNSVQDVVTVHNENDIPTVNANQATTQTDEAVVTVKQPTIKIEQVGGKTEIKSNDVKQSSKQSQPNVELNQEIQSNTTSNNTTFANKPKDGLKRHQTQTMSVEPSRTIRNDIPTNPSNGVNTSNKQHNKQTIAKSNGDTTSVPLHNNQKFIPNKVKAQMIKDTPSQTVSINTQNHNTESVDINNRQQRTSQMNNASTQPNVKMGQVNQNPVVVKPSLNHIYKLGGNAKGIVPVIIDVKQREAIWVNTLDKNPKANLDMRNFTKYANVLVDMYGKNDRMTMADMAKLITIVNNGTITTNPSEARVLFTTKKHDGVSVKQINTQPQTVINVVAIQPELWLKQLMSPVGKTTEEIKLQEQIRTQANKSLLDAFEAIIIEQERRNNILKREAEEQASTMSGNIIDGMEMDQKIMEKKMNPEKLTQETINALDEASEQFAKDLEEEQQLDDLLESFAIGYNKDDKDETVIDTGDEEEFELD